MNPGRRVVRDVGMDLRLTKGIEWVEVSALKMTTRQMRVSVMQTTMGYAWALALQ